MRFSKYAATIPALALALPLLSLVSPAQAATVYKAPADVLGGLCPTCAGTATKLGDDITLAAGARGLTKLIWDTSNFGADYDADIKVDLFNVDLTGAAPAVGSQFHTQTSTHFLAGGNGVSERTFVDIAMPSVVTPGRFIYSIEVLNNNGSTNWNVAGQFANNAADEDETLAQAQVGTNNEFDVFFGDWVSTFNDPGPLTFQRLGMASYQLGLPQNASFASYSNMTPNVTFIAPVPVPAALPLLLAGLGGLGLVARRKRKAA